MSCEWRAANINDHWLALVYKSYAKLCETFWKITWFTLLVWVEQVSYNVKVDFGCQILIFLTFKVYYLALKIWNAWNVYEYINVYMYMYMCLCMRVWVSVYISVKKMIFYEKAKMFCVVIDLFWLQIDWKKWKGMTGAWEYYARSINSWLFKICKDVI